MRALFALPIVATFSLAFATFALMSGASEPARAFGTHHAFCLTGDEWPGLSTARSTPIRSVRRARRAGALTCIANPYFGGESDDPYAYPNRPRAPTPGYSPSSFWLR